MKASEAVFYPGQQVVLRSGSPIMTVNDFFSDNSWAGCFWFDCALGAERYEVKLPSTVLKLYNGESEIVSDALLVTPSVGDVVQLRGGGPLMTVEFVRINEFENNVSCIWFDEQCRSMAPYSGGFHSNALVIKS